MRVLVFYIFFLSSFLFALDVTITDGQSGLTHLVINLKNNNLYENRIAQKIIANFDVLGRVSWLKTHGEQGSFAAYREQGVDFLLSLAVEQQDETQQLLVKLVSPWGASLQTSSDKWPVLLDKEFQFTTVEELLIIGNQVTDAVAEKALCVQGFASYPLAYVHRDDLSQIIVTDLGGDLTQLLYETDAPLLSLTWSPDARQLAFIELTADGPVLKIIDRSQKKVRSLVSGYYVASPLFSHDQRYLYYVAAPVRVGQIFRRDLVTGATEALTTGQDWMIDMSIGYDDYHLLVTADRTGGAQLYEFNILTKKFKRLTFSEAECSKGILSSQNQAMFYSMLSDTVTVLMKRSFLDKNYEAMTLVNGAEGATFPKAAGLIAFEHMEEGHSRIAFKSLYSGKEIKLV
jgi:hypothetical protein